ncbi:MAG: hypothetical protein NC211_09015 [Alistipes senegalensis]|nr:transcriptional regulator [Oxalobacter formigenes]MCM1281948.1 hypothetical protein [Alistipes senegalensis]
MYTISETNLFTEEASSIWNEDERGEFCAWLATNPEAGDVIPRSGGCHKVRWKRSGMGKSDVTRVIYFNRLSKGEICLLMIYAKTVRGNIPAHILKSIAEELKNA